MIGTRKLIRNVLARLGFSKEDEHHSLVLRQRFRQKGVEVGLYSYGCFDLSRIPPGTVIGRYCSFASSSQVFLRNHGIDFIGLTAYLYNPSLGVVEENKIALGSLKIGDDVWLGHNCVLLPSVCEVGRGAVVAAGAVVTKPVPAYAVVAGNPARVIRMRFDDATIARIEATRWWELDLYKLRELVRDHPDMIFDPQRFFTTSDPIGPA